MNTTTHTRANIDGVDSDCSEGECGHEEDSCPTEPVDACEECTARSWEENEGGIITWTECGGTGATFAEVDAENLETGRTGDDLADAIERGDTLTEVEQLRVVLAAKMAQIARLTASDQWEYRGVVFDQDRNVIESWRIRPTAEEAYELARDWGILDEASDVPGAVLGVERRRKAGEWEETSHV